MSEQKFFVYLLRRTDNNRVVYVGETNCPERRFKQHMEGDTLHTEAIAEWAKRTGVGIKMQIVGTFNTRQEARRYETQLINRAWDTGYWIANNFLIKTPTTRRRGKYWSEREMQQVLHMYNVEQRSVLEIARSLERTCGGVKDILTRHGIDYPDFPLSDPASCSMTASSEARPADSAQS